MSTLNRARAMVAALCLACGTTAFVGPRGGHPLRAPPRRAAATAVVDALKQDLLTSIGRRAGEAEILRRAAPRRRTARAAWRRWALVYSTQTASPRPGSALLSDLPQEISNRIYGLLFKVVDVTARVVDNRVRITALGQTLKLRVFGSAEATDDADRLAITFEGFDVNDVVTLPLPRPRGEIVTTYVDGDLRLSRGSRGGLFVLKRMPAGS
ncbi:PAP fibrillin [Aureococcus anophagefferens]|nr:PAP fibrillin [Aureococcus anophagefferens]